MSSHKLPNLRFVIMRGCNFNCSYCYESNYNEAKIERMSEAVVEHALGLYAQSTGYEIDIFGGEPMLHWPLVRKIFE
jgi:sulfatase maturation enzyme AslB (radical SAM superfamily)